MAIESGGHQPPVPHNRMGLCCKRGKITKHLDLLDFSFHTQCDFQKDSRLSERVTGVKRREPRAGHLRRLELLSSQTLSTTSAPAFSTSSQLPINNVKSRPSELRRTLFS